MAKEIHCRVWYCDARGGSWQNGGVAQYIKGQWDNGEYNLLQPLGLSFILWEPVLPGRHRTGKRYRRGERGLVGKQTDAG